MAKNYYLILGITADATKEDIKAAFRRRAMELHPDRSGLGSGPFQEAQEAYSVLADPDRRRRYDRLGDRLGNLHHQHDDALDDFDERRWRRGHASDGNRPVG